MAEVRDLIPGVNVGNILKQGGDILGFDGQFGSQTDYDISDNYTLSGRSGQTSLLPGDSFGVVQGATTVNKPTVTQPQSPSAPVNNTYTDANGKVWASRGAYDTGMANIRRNVNVKEGGYVADARNTNAGNRVAYTNDSQDFVGGQRTGQNTINTNRVNNALNLRRSMAAIASGLRTGIRSGAVNLANMNAMDSGAADAMARAFARQGNSQAGQVNNEAQLVENTAATDQTNLGIQREQGLGRLKTWRETKIGEVSSKLWQNLNELDASAQAEGVTGEVDMGARDRVVSQASSELDAIDTITEQELAKITALDYGQVQEQAAQMDAAGAGATPFAYEGGNVQFNGGMGGTGNMAGAPIGPVGTAPRYREDETSILPAGWRTQDETKVA